MCNQSTLCAAPLALWLFLRIAVAGDVPNPVLTGTVNIVLANGNGIVVLTDSNQTGKSSTGEPFTAKLPGQKLFVIDSQTVCTIAGFGSKPLPDYPELTTSAAAVLDMYAKKLQDSGGTHSFREKLSSLEFLFDNLLHAVGNLQHLDQVQLRDYGLELILAGYDTDGTAKIGKLVFSSRLSPENVLTPVVDLLEEETVGRELVYEKAGIGGAAVENILEHPMQLADEPEIGRYAKSKVADHGSSLTTAEMEALAKSLSRHSALVNSTYVNGLQKMWPVGGRNQIATLEKGKIQSVDLPTVLFAPRKLDLPRFDLFTGGNLPGDTPGFGLITENTGAIILFLKASFRGGRVRLDRRYYFEDNFTNVTVYYDGGVLGFDSSNRITDCVLSLGPHVDRKSVAVQKLIAGFPWKAVQ